MPTSSSKWLIGMLHLPPLPGSPRYGGDWSAVVESALRDAAAIVRGGLKTMVIENFGDAPFHPGPVPATTIAAMTGLAQQIRSRFDVRLGINVLRNDGCAAMAIAQAVWADFIRVNILSGARLTDQGVIQGIAHDLLRLRRSLEAEAVEIFADVNVKHSAPLAQVPLEQEVGDLIHRGLADALIVTGWGTGAAAPMDELKAVKRLAGRVPVLVGSGVTDRTLGDYLSCCDGAIVGTWIKKSGRVENPVDLKRVRSLVKISSL